MNTGEPTKQWRKKRERKEKKNTSLFYLFYWVCPLGTNTIILEEEPQVRKCLHQIIYKQVCRAYFCLMIDVGGPRPLGVGPHLGP